MGQEDENIVQIVGVKKRYGENEVLKGIDINIKKNSVIGLIGDNGAGKTTLIKCICGLVKQTEGIIEFSSRKGKSIEEYRRENVGVLLEGARNLYHFLSVEDNLDYFGYLNKLSQCEIDARKERLLQIFDLKEFRKKTVNELSRGMQQKVALMVIMMKEPQMMILDEPTLGLDLISTMKMIDLLGEIANQGKTIIIISHDLSLIKKVCDRIIYIKKGKIEFDEVISEIVENDNFLVKVKYDETILSKIINDNLDYCLEDGVIVVKTAELENVLRVVPKEYLFEIEKRNSTLEEYVRERLVNGHA